MLVGLVTNPVSGRGRGGRRADEIRSMLIERAGVHGIGVMDLTGGSRAESEANVRDWLGVLDAVVVAGGDGMMSLGVNVTAGTGVPLGVIACGSGNDAARNLMLPVNRIPVAIEGLVAGLVEGSGIRLDVGRAVSIPDNGGRFDVRFINSINCGLDAVINEKANRSHLPNGSLRYLAAGITSILGLREYSYEIDYEDVDGVTRHESVSTPLLLASNGRYCGGGMEVSPNSLMDDGLLDVIGLDHGTTRMQSIRALVSSYSGGHLAKPYVSWTRVRSLTVRPAPGCEPHVFMADGESVGVPPVRITVEHDALRMLVPPSVAKWWAERADGEHERVAAAIAALGSSGN